MIIYTTILSTIYYAMVERYQERYWLLGLDLSKAFDSLDREELLRIFRVEVGATEDELRILRTLLADTSLRTCIGKMTGQSFPTTIGTPQGDALSPCLFLVYFEFVMRTLDHRFPRRQGHLATCAFSTQTKPTQHLLTRGHQARSSPDLITPPHTYTPAPAPDSMLSTSLRTSQKSWPS